MCIQFKIHCCACFCSFELNSEQFRQKTDLECPNCGQRFPRTEYQKLQTVMNELRGIREVCADSSSEKGFKISVEEARNTDELPF